MVGFLEVYNGEFGVVFEGVEGFVAEHFFDVVEVGACADHFGGAASAEGVEGDAGLEVCVFGVVVEDSAQCVVGHFLSCVVEEEGLLLGVVFECGSDGCQVGGEESCGGVADGDDPLFVSFTGDQDGLVFEVKIGELDAEDFAGSDSAGVEEFEEGPISISF